MSEKAMKTNHQKPTYPAHFTGKPTKQKHTKTSKLSQAAELAQRSHYHRALFPRVGASGTGPST